MHLKCMKILRHRSFVVFFDGTFLLMKDGFYVGELMNGERGLVPSNFVERIAGMHLGVHAS